MAYSDAEVTEAMIRLAVNKYDYEKTAEQVGCTSRSLRNWEKSFPKKSVPDLLERAIERLLMVIPEKMDGNTWAVTLGILIDKWLLIQGQATSRTELMRVLRIESEDELSAVIREAERILAGSSGGVVDSVLSGQKRVVK
jgi:hypothetical protein